MARTHIHKHKKKSNRTRKVDFKKFFSPRFFIVLGVIFLLTGAYFSLSSSESSNSLYEMILNFFKPSETKLVDVEGSGFGTLLFYFVPAVLILILSGAYARKFSSITFPVSILIALYLIGIQIYLYHFALQGGCYYQNSLMASVFLFLPVLLILFSAFLHRKSVLLILSCFYFYITIVLFAGWYSVQYLDFLFIFVLIFSSLIAWIGQKMERPTINLINFVFAISFFGFVFLRKFIVNSKPEFLPEYFLFGTLYYILFYAVELFSANANQKPLPKWMQWVISGTNVSFFVGSMSYILLKYYTYTHLCVFVTALLLINLIVLILLKKYVPAERLLPHQYISVLLAALLLPLWIQQDRIFLFTAGFSVFMFLFAGSSKDRFALGISRTAMTVAIGLYFFFWISAYLPAIVIERILPDAALLWKGVLQGGILLLVLLVTKGILSQELNLPATKKWFHVRNYDRIITLFQYITLFLLSGWIVFSLLCQFTGTINYTAVGWFITGSLFFIFLIRYYAGKQSEFKKPVLYLGFVVVLLYPLLWGWDVQGGNFIHTLNLDNVAITLHYLAVTVWIVLGTMTVRRIYKRNTKYPFLKQGVQIVSVIYLAFFLCIEFNNLNILIALAENSSTAAVVSGNAILAFNQFVPFTIVLGILSVVVFLVAFLRHKPFLRSCALGLLIVVLIKVFAFDFPQLAPEQKSVEFIVLGILFIVFALLYPVMQKIKNKKKELPPDPLKGE